jgi:uncharacterized protein YndB with AHSA1/START domain
VTEISATPDVERGEVTFTREFEAPRELVFRALMDPAQLVHFWGPPGAHVPLDSVVIEPWAGGRFENTIVADDATSEFPFRAVFIEVVEPERLAFREVESGLVSTSTFTDLGAGRTRLVIHQTNVPLAYRSPETLAGFANTLDLLADHLATLVRPNQNVPPTT